MAFGVCALTFASIFLAAAASQTGCLDDSCSDDASLLSIKSKVIDGSSVDTAMQESLALDREFAKAAQAMPKGAVSHDLLRTFRICGQCNNFVRYGEQHDGGYLMCMDGVNSQSTKAAYSMGVEHHDQWSEDVIKNLRIPVNQFDCTVSESSCASCKFFKKCIVSSDGQHPVPGHEADGWTLNQVLKETGEDSAPGGSLLMKMDIEASEWPVLSTEPPEFLQKFGELIVEFHWLDREANHPMYLQAMQNILAAGFQVAHLHGNNYGGMYEVGEASIPNVVEVTFVHSAVRPGQCSTTQLYDQQLDAPNNPAAAELPMAHVA